MMQPTFPILTPPHPILQLLTLPRMFWCFPDPGFVHTLPTETGWDQAPFATVLQCLHLDTPLLQQQRLKKMYGTEDNCMHAQLVQILDKRYKETKKPNCHF